MGKKQERGREPESWAENGIERKRRDQKVKRSRSQTEQGAQLSDVREGEEERRGRGQRGRRRRESNGQTDRAGRLDEERREAGEQGRERVSQREGARARGDPASVTSSLLQTLTMEAACQGLGRGHVPALLVVAL